MAFDPTKPADTETFGAAPGIIRANQAAIAAHHAGASSPTNPQEGWVWLDTTVNLFKAYHGGVWVPVGNLLSDVAEVVTARGAAAALASRLNVSMNADGTMKVPLGGGSEWYLPGLTATYSSPSVITLPGDVTAVFPPGRRAKATLTGGLVYLTVKSSVFTSLTTVTFLEATLDNTLSALEISFVTGGATGSIPRSAIGAPVANMAALPSTSNVGGDLRGVTAADSVCIWDDTDKAWIPAGQPQLFAYPQASPNLTVRVRPGVAYIGGVQVELVGATNSPSVTAPTVNPRIDVLTLDGAGVLAWTTGAEAPSPVAPTYPTSKVPVCEIYLRVGSTAINAPDLGSHGYIKKDVRPGMAAVPNVTAIPSGGTGQTTANAALNALLPAQTSNSGKVLASDGSNSSWATPSGVAVFKRGVINGSGIVVQRTVGTDVIKNAAASTYVFGACDRFTGAWSGSTCTAGSLNQDTAAAVGRTGYAHHFSGVTLTGTGILYHRHRIESLIAKNYKNQTCSLSVKVLHDVGSNVNFTAYLRKPTTTADVFSAVTEIANSGQVSIASGASATVTFQNVAMGDCSKGIEIEIKAEVGAITSKNLRLTEYQLEVGSVATDFEFEGYSETLAKCQRYYLDWQGANGLHVWLDSWLPVGQNQVVSFGFPVQMRVASTVIKTGTWAVGNTGQPTVNSTTPNGVSLMISATPSSTRTFATPNGVAATGLTASAEL